MLSLRKLTKFLSRSSYMRKFHELPELPYECDGLEPILSGEQVHHHYCQHAEYVDELNTAEKRQAKALEKGDISTLLTITPLVSFNAGGHINHSLYWKSFSTSPTKPSPCFSGAIDKSFGSFENMQKELTKVCKGVTGSGWGWLAFNPRTGKIVTKFTLNEDALEATTGLVPLFGVDLWEHAYYLQFKNSRAKYVTALFDIIDWCEITQRYEEASGNPSCSAAK